MISLSSASSQPPLQPGDDLIAQLGTSARPAVIHYAGADRTELSGRVAVNWATKTTHLFESYGIASPDLILVDLPVTWRSTVLMLGVAWSGLETTHDADEAAAILTDTPAPHLQAAAEIFVTQGETTDASLINVDDEVLSHPDQGFLEVPDLIGQTAATEITSDAITTYRGGTLITTAGLRLDAHVWASMVNAWRHHTPVVLVDEAAAEQREAILAAERLV